MYAIIATGGKQYKVAAGDFVNVEKLGVEAGETVTFDNVLAVNDDNGLKFGNDVANASVTATVMENGKAKKVIVYKFKRSEERRVGKECRLRRSISKMSGVL